MPTHPMLPSSIGGQPALPVGLATASLDYRLWPDGQTTLAHEARRVPGSQPRSAGAQ
jgi:hypothetical protein